jgi:hypothetical protein
MADKALFDDLSEELFSRCPVSFQGSQVSKTPRLYLTRIERDFGLPAGSVREAGTEDNAKYLGAFSHETKGLIAWMLFDMKMEGYAKVPLPKRGMSEQQRKLLGAIHVKTLRVGTDYDDQDAVEFDPDTSIFVTMFDALDSLRPELEKFRRALYASLGELGFDWLFLLEEVKSAGNSDQWFPRSSARLIVMPRESGRELQEIITEETGVSPRDAENQGLFAYPDNPNAKLIAINLQDFIANEVVPVGEEANPSYLPPVSPRPTSYGRMKAGKKPHAKKKKSISRKKRTTKKTSSSSSRSSSSSSRSKKKSSTYRKRQPKKNAKKKNTRGKSKKKKTSSHSKRSAKAKAKKAANIRRKKSKSGRSKK